MNIYSTRHGQTDLNKAELILGTTDVELNETGLLQADELAGKIAEMNCIDIIISSPMKRALKTSGIVSEKTGIPVITDERLREWDYGRYEGKARFTDGFSENKINFGMRMGETGESLLQLSHRVFSALDDIIRNFKNKNVLVVSHGGVCRVIEMYFHDMTTEVYSGWFMENCGIIHYSTEEGGEKL
ncbi:MAG: histidine phosphatase family protein [Ruminococcus sp.]|nr:histidine phosphatase family protein [Ruminococcus sp.]